MNFLSPCSFFFDVWISCCFRFFLEKKSVVCFWNLEPHVSFRWLGHFRDFLGVFRTVYSRSSRDRNFRLPRFIQFLFATFMHITDIVLRIREEKKMKKKDVLLPVTQGAAALFNSPASLFRGRKSFVDLHPSRCLLSFVFIFVPCECNPPGRSRFTTVFRSRVSAPGSPRQ